MPRLPVLTAKQIIKILEANGFELDHTTGSHFIFRHLITKQRVTVPHHSKDLPKGTLLSIVRQAGLTKADF